MESVGTKSYRQRASDTVGFEAPTPHIVVVCPSCKTSFAVETAAVAALETPRFHCSRCDDIFVMKDAPADMLPLGGVNVQSLSHAGHAHRASQPRGRGPTVEPLIKPSDFSLGSSASAPRTFIEPNFDAPPEGPVQTRSELSLLSRTIDEAITTSPEDTDQSFACERQDSEGTSPASALEKTSSIEEPLSIHGFVVSPVATSAPSLSSRQFVLSDPAPSLPEHALTTTRDKATAQSSLKPLRTALPASQEGHPLSSTESYRPTPQPRRPEAQHAQTGNQRRLSVRTQGLLSLGAPLLGSLAVLLGMSYCAQISPQSVDALMNYISPSPLKESVQSPPPSALGVKALRISFKKTRNKEFIPVVTGTVLNESARGFEGVELEVIGFNGRGEIIASSKAPLRSPLTKETVSELSAEMVGSYQKTLSGKDSSIKGRESVPFTVALVNARQIDAEMGAFEFDPSKVKYFSARIFSIKRPK